MQRRFSRLLTFLRATLIGGVLFLLPLAAIGWLLAQAGAIVWGVVNAVKENPAITAWAPFHTPAGYVLLVVLTIAALVGVCFLCGILAEKSLGQWFHQRAERYLSMLFPRYAVFKDQLTGNLGTGSLRPVLARVGPWTRIAVEVERDPQVGVTVYLPSSPDPWTGTVAIVPADDVTPITGDFAEVMATFEQLGRGTIRFAATASGESFSPSIHV